MTILEIADLVRAATNLLRIAERLDKSDREDVAEFQRDVKILTEFLYDTEFTTIGRTYEERS